MAHYPPSQIVYYWGWGNPISRKHGIELIWMELVSFWWVVSHFDTLACSKIQERVFSKLFKRLRQAETPLGKWGGGEGTTHYNTIQYPQYPHPPHPMLGGWGYWGYRIVLCCIVLYCPPHLPRGVSACRRRFCSGKTCSWMFENVKVSKWVKAHQTDAKSIQTH